MIEPPGSQLWADVRWREGWRIQRRWGGAKHRLLDPSGRTFCKGTFEECERTLERACPTATPVPHLVVLLHGLGRTRRALHRLDAALRDAGLTTARLDYPSTRCSIEEHAATIADLLDHIPTPDRLAFVSHSLGNLIVRRLLAYDRPWRNAIGRIVMIAPPNQGASLAASLDKGGVLRAVLGPSFGQIADGFAVTLPVPRVPVAIFAGDAAGVTGDGLLTVPETHLPGAAQHDVVPAIHTFVMNHPDVIEGTVSFLTAAPD